MNMRQMHILYNSTIHSLKSYCFRIAKLFRNVDKNNFALICCKFLANLYKSSEILEQCHVKWWLKYRSNRSVSWRLSCNIKYERDLWVLLQHEQLEKVKVYQFFIHGCLSYFCFIHSSYILVYVSMMLNFLLLSFCKM